MDKTTPEELAAEQVALQEKKEDEVRESIITEYGFDEVVDAERIEKLVAKEIDHSKKLSSAIGQKIKHRTYAEELRNAKPPEVKKDNVNLDPETLNKSVSEILEKRELDSMEYPDDLKGEIKKVASSLGITIKQALKDPYIVFKIDAHKKDNDIDDASISRTNKSGSKKVPTFESPPDVDMTTAEGRQKWEDYKADMMKKGH